MMNWQALPVPSDATVNAFWLNPLTGALLLTAFLQGSSGESLFTSVDGGVRWTQLPTPSIAQLTWTIQAPQGEGPWRICGSAALGDSGLEGNSLIRSSDSGQTWVAQPALSLPKNPLNPFEFATAGAALATSGAADHIYRLTAGDTVWQDLGPEPAPFINPGIVYFPTPTGGALWMCSGCSALALRCSWRRSHQRRRRQLPHSQRRDFFLDVSSPTPHPSWVKEVINVPTGVAAAS